MRKEGMPESKNLNWSNYLKILLLTLLRFEQTGGSAYCAFKYDLTSLQILLIPVLQNSRITRTGSRPRSVRLYLGLEIRRVEEQQTIWTSLNLIALVAQGQLVVLGSHVIHCSVSPILHLHTVHSSSRYKVKVSLCGYLLTWRIGRSFLLLQLCSVYFHLVKNAK